MFGKRFSRAMAITTVASLVMATAALADNLEADADALATSSPAGNALNANQQPGTTVSYDLSAAIKETGNANDDVFPGSVVVTVARSGDWLAADAGAPASLSLTAYDTNAAGTIRVTVPCGTTPGTVEAMSAVLTAAASTNGKTLNPDSVSLTYTITAQGADAATCAPSNAAPVLTWNTSWAAANEGDILTYSFSITDAVADSHTFVAAYPDCGAGNVVSDATIDNTANTGSFKCSFPDGLIPAEASAIKVKVQDSGTPSLASNELTVSTTVSNVNPTVAAGFGGAVDCRTSSTLTIDPDDLGIYDSPWKVNINWGDGSLEPEITRNDLASFTVTHTYALAGTYNAIVSVADKDTGSGSDAANSITVNQTYTVDFLAPFDDSSPSGLIVNKMKNGRVVPVKATIYDDCALAPVTDPATAVTISVSKTSGTGGTADPVETYADAGQSSAGTSLFRWSDDGFWIYNLDSKALGLVTGNFYSVDIYVGSVKATVDNWAVLNPVK
jgi:hypothetical protein